MRSSHKNRATDLLFSVERYSVSEYGLRKSEIGPNLFTSEGWGRFG